MNLILISTSPRKHNNIARFKLSSHNLKIETGRHETPKIPLEERKCNKCDSNDIEDELHCLFICNNNAAPRNQLILKATNLIPNFHNLDKTRQFKALMSNNEPEMIYSNVDFNFHWAPLTCHFLDMTTMT